MTDLTGQAVQVDQVESTTTLWDIPVLATNELAKMKVFIADLTNLAEVGSWVEMTMKISGVYKADANKASCAPSRARPSVIDRAAVVTFLSPRIVPRVRQIGKSGYT